MLRSICAVAVLLALSGCGQKQSADETSYAAASAPPPAPMMADKRMAEPAPEGPKLAYSHRLSIETKSETVKQRFEQVRDGCLNGVIPGCVLLRANIEEVGFDQERHPEAMLSVRLTHEGVVPFERAVLQPLAGEQPNDVAVQSRSTSAEDLTAAILDGDRRLAQLSDYRDRLTQIAKRADAKVDDLIKVEGEISSTQSQIEELTADQHKLGERVATELETVQISGRVAVGKGSDIAEVWHRAGRLFDRNVANALEGVIQAAPWVITALFLLLLLPVVRVLVRVLWRISRRRG